jgi:hypothetical protein
VKECDVEQNKVDCSCTYEPCPRKGNCCQCVRHHRKKGQLPACFFPEDVERTYDRSVRALAEAYRTRGQWW